MSRIGPAFERARGATGLVPFLTAGYPSLEGTLDLMTRLDRGGAIALEIGIPFSDPIADGPEIQRASEHALRLDVGPEQTLEVVRAFRRQSELPVVVMTYANPILRRGIESFANAANAAGVDGVIVSDLPPEEAPEVWEALARAGLDTILLVAPTTGEARLARVIDRCRGFLYCLARTGVTGKAAGVSGPIAERIATLRRLTRLPIAIGFGISTPANAAALRGQADAIVVGAAFMNAIAQSPDRGVERAESLGRELIAALR